jgi:hypothetical protein
MLSLGQFSAMLMQYMETWSNNCEANVKIMHHQPVVDLPLWTAAYQWAKLEKTIITENTTDCHIFYSAAKDKRDFTDNSTRILSTNQIYEIDQYGPITFVLKKLPRKFSLVKIATKNFQQNVSTRIFYFLFY